MTAPLSIKCGVCGEPHRIRVPQTCVTVLDLAAALQAYVLSQGPTKYNLKAEELVELCKRVRGFSP